MPWEEAVVPQSFGFSHENVNGEDKFEWGIIIDIPDTGLFSSAAGDCLKNETPVYSSGYHTEFSLS